MKGVNLETATHVAGPVVKIDKRCIQRCCVCGEKLADSNDPDLFVFWQEGEMLQTQEGKQFPNRVGSFLNISQTPDDFCIDLVEP